MSGAVSIAKSATVPSGWRQVVLADVCRILNGFAFDSARFSQKRGTPLIRIRDLKTNTPSEHYDGEFDEQYLVPPGAFLIGMDGEFRCYKWSGPPALLNQRLCRLLPDERAVHGDFAYLALNDHLKRIEDETSYTTVKHISSKQIAAIEMALPPFPEQKRIAAALREQLDAAARMRAAADESAREADALWRRAVELRLSGTSLARYPTRPLIDVCRRNGQYGTSVKSNRDGIGVAVLGMPNIGFGRLSWSPLSHVDLGPAEVEKYRLNDGDLLFNRTNSAELVGKTAVFRDKRDSVFASYLVRFVADPSVAVPEYLSYLLNSGIGRRFIEGNMARAIGQVNISASAMHRFPVPLPPLSEQDDLVSQLDNCRRVSDAVAGAAEVQAAEIGRLPAALLRRAFGGGTRRSSIKSAGASGLSAPQSPGRSGR